MLRVAECLLPCGIKQIYCSILWIYGENNTTQNGGKNASLLDAKQNGENNTKHNGGKNTLVQSSKQNDKNNTKFKAQRRRRGALDPRVREEAEAPRVGADIAGSCEVREGAVRTSLWQCCGGGSASAVVDSSGASCVDSGGGSGW